jgi:hypothetical protein
MSTLLFFIAMFCGYMAGRISTKSDSPPLDNTEQKLKDELTVAQNLNDSLLRDLQEAKETIRKLKNAS